jgi:hypothetical protein
MGPSNDNKGFFWGFSIFNKNPDTSDLSANDLIFYHEVKKAAEEMIERDNKIIKDSNRIIEGCIGRPFPKAENSDSSRSYKILNDNEKNNKVIEKSAATGLKNIEFNFNYLPEYM